MTRQVPLPPFHIVVELGDDRAGFAEVSGLTREDQAAEHRGGSSSGRPSGKTPGLRKRGNVTLKRGIMNRDGGFFAWLNAVESGLIGPRDLKIKLLDERCELVTVWKIHNALPLKINGPALNALGVEFAIESVELVHEGIEIQQE